MVIPVVYHIPVCPFSQRLEILLALKGASDAVAFQLVDVTQPRDPALLEKTAGSTALPVLETEEGQIIKESLVILRYLEERFPEPRVAAQTPERQAIENALIELEGPFCAAGYRFVMNQDRAERARYDETMRARYAELDAFLLAHNPKGTYLFDDFGLSETVFTPFFMRFWFLEYYEDFALPTGELERVQRWRDACLAHPAAQQVDKERIVKLYYDYAKGAGNGALLPGRRRSSFAMDPHWSKRPWPPRDKYGHSASDAELGLEQG